jgi:hypothetical protein
VYALLARLLLEVIFNCSCFGDALPARLLLEVIFDRSCFGDVYALLERLLLEVILYNTYTAAVAKCRVVLWRHLWWLLS